MNAIETLMQEVDGKIVQLQQLRVVRAQNRAAIK